MKYQYEKAFDTAYSSVDRTGRLGLVACLDINQDMITEFYGSIGSDNLVLRRNDNAAWFYIRTRLHAAVLPLWHTRTRATTYVTALSPVRLDLETVLRDEAGALLFAARTQMCAIDFARRVPCRIAGLTFPRDLEPLPAVLPGPYPRLAADLAPSDFVLAETIHAADTDFTRHTNNTRYAKAILDTYGSDFFDTRIVTDFDIHFQRETREGDELRIHRREPAGDEADFLITASSAPVVLARLRHAPLPSSARLSL